MKIKNLIQLILLILIFTFLYFHTILHLISEWSVDPNFSHGFLVPFIALYMVWHKKDVLSNIPIEPSNIGMFLIVFGMLTHVIGNIGAESFMMRTSMIVTICGIIIYFCGIKMFKAVLIPVAYLIIMVPIPAIIWNKIAFPLQLFAANLSSQIINVIGIPVFREGNILHLANISFEVVDACSGLRSLTALLALTGVFAYLAPLSNLKKWILFFSAIPIAVAVNIVRLTITALMATYISLDAANGFVHDMSGLVLFMVALLLVYMLFAIELKIEKYKRRY
ncbi:MAG: exosortase/archaeosortase family protein [Desulfobacteraceae bacterium]|nr:exosortase/archaeosortase family protein [Desulfobacteraceae bacterium]